MLTVYSIIPGVGGSGGKGARDILLFRVMEIPSSLSLDNF
jgi:hypothetical protein